MLTPPLRCFNFGIPPENSPPSPGIPGGGPVRGSAGTLLALLVLLENPPGGGTGGRGSAIPPIGGPPPPPAGFPTGAAERSLVWAFLSRLPAWICWSKAPLSAIVRDYDGSEV
ncbi:hypothetical protein IWW47_000192 [Coemansia sp. RSA 2052]|nr:hypothetical protein GGF38_006134 [Coemansia sp. RSA 25]KAJ2509149.1 hypothetical protein IWW47_000192 [Coemansia sp. RSA 2052]